MAILGASWGRLGAVLGAAWAASWCQVAVLGASWAHLGAVLGRLGRQVGAKWPSWARLEAVLGGLGRDFGAKMGPKIDQKTDQKLEAISRSIFGVTPECLEPTCSDFGPSWAPWIFKRITLALKPLDCTSRVAPFQWHAADLRGVAMILSQVLVFRLWPQNGGNNKIAFTNKGGRQFDVFRKVFLSVSQE